MEMLQMRMEWEFGVMNFDFLHEALFKREIRLDVLVRTTFQGRPVQRVRSLTHCTGTRAPASPDSPGAIGPERPHFGSPCNV